VSVSVGAAVQVSPDEPIGEVVAAADKALYRAKRQGRDRVVAG
jgi:PleD family two-component response regulator